jgi:hypothetical protein
MQQYKVLECKTKKKMPRETVMNAGEKNLRKRWKGKKNAASSSRS